MREERFRIQCPEHFQVGDSGRFEKPSQDKESDFVVDYAPPEMFEAGIVLQEMGTEGDTYCTMYVYFAPEEHLPVYMDSMKYDLQKVSIRKIFVDTEEYLIKVNENDYIRGTGSFSSAMNGLQLLQREIHNKKLFKPIIIKMTLNSQNKNEWKQFAEYFDKLNINEVIINSITVAGRAQKYDFLKLDDNEYEELVDKIYHRYALLNNPSYILFVHSLRPLAYIFFNIKYNMNSMVCFPDCVSNNGGFSMDMNGKLYSCSENKAEFLMSNGQIKSIPNSLIERHDEINNFLEDNELFNQKRDKLNQERRSLSCLKCRWKARCNPCQFLTNNEYNEMERKCLKYKEKILNLIESNISLGKARIILKESAYIHMKNKRLKFINCYRNGKYLVSSEFDFCNWQNNVINIIIQNQSYLIEKKDLNKKDFISFIYDLLTTDCFYMVE